MSAISPVSSSIRGPVSPRVDIGTFREKFRALVDSKVTSDEHIYGSGAPSRYFPGKNNFGASPVLYMLGQSHLGKFDPAIAAVLREAMAGPVVELPRGNKMGGGVVEVWSSHDVETILNYQVDQLLQKHNVRRGFLNLFFTRDARTLDSEERLAFMREVPKSLLPFVNQTLEAMGVR